MWDYVLVSKSVYSLKFSSWTRGDISFLSTIDQIEQGKAPHSVDKRRRQFF